MSDPRPLVSVITPTWQRHDLLLSRCIPSVAAQTYPNVEHIVVSDGPDEALAAAMAGLPDVTFLQLPVHDPEARWGHWARLAGIEAARGQFIAYLDDDNAYRDRHLLTVMDLLVASGAAFGYSRMQVRGSWGDPRRVVGTDPPVYGEIDTSSIVHRRELLERAGTWEQSLPTIDWDLVDRWLGAGASWVFSPEITHDYHLGPGR